MRLPNKQQSRLATWSGSNVFEARWIVVANRVGEWVIELRSVHLRSAYKLSGRGVVDTADADKSFPLVLS